MADLLIKGLELPTEERISLSIYPNGIVVNHSTLKVEKNRTTAIELPSHGRLIDLDAYLKAYENMSDWEEYRVEEIEEYFKNAPVVVKASK